MQIIKRVGQLAVYGSVFLTAAATLAGEAGKSSVAIPVNPGESLLQVVKRVHPCPVRAGDFSLSRIMRDNPEVIGSDGRFVLNTPTVMMPKKFVDSGRACFARHEIKNETRPARKPAEAVVEPPVVETAKSEGNREEIPPANQLTLGTFVEFSRVNVHDFSGNQALLTSKPEFGYQLAYARWASKHAFFGVHYRYAKSEFQELEGRELQEASSSLRSAGLNGGYEIAHETFATIDLGAAQIDHVSFLDDGATVYVDHFWVPRISLGVKTKFVEWAGFEFGAGVSAILYLPARGLADTSPAESAEVFAEREINRFLSVELGAGGTLQRQGYEDESHYYTSYGVDLGIGIHF